MSWTTPKTWNVGDAATAADMNTYVRDNPGFLYGDGGWTGVASFSNGWGAAVGFPPGYILIGRVVYLHGWLGTAGTAGATAFTLPTGYRPSLQVTRAQPGATSTTVNEVHILTTGDVQPQNSVGTWLDLSFAVV